jgi:HSP20 family molecular chaperone IbpA
MNEKTEVKSPETDAAREARSAGYALRPPMNVFEDATGITLEADMPGVSKDRLRLQVDQDSLLIEGDILFTMPDAMEALYADVRETHYRRSFALSRELDSEHIEASLKDGVLRLRIPKRAEVQPRKIEVRVD